MRPLLKKLRLPECTMIDDLNASETTLLHKTIIEKKALLKKFYTDLYHIFLTEAAGDIDGTFLELGSGGGFLKHLSPRVITSDILPLPHIDVCLNALHLPFKNHSLNGIFMLNVFHHIPDVQQFLSESLRCLKPGGSIIMIEPANTVFSRFIYKNLHHEPFIPNSPAWNFESTGPMTSANGALPWIVFTRDRELLHKMFPQLMILSIKNHSPLRYLLSGGFTLKQLAPASAYPIVKGIEFLLTPLNNMLGMFSTIILQSRQ